MTGRLGQEGIKKISCCLGVFLIWFYKLRVAM